MYKIMLGWFFAVPVWMSAQSFSVLPPEARGPLMAQNMPAPPAAPAPPDVAGFFGGHGGGYLGVGIQEITGERAKTLKLKEEAGVEITNMAADSPAEKAGVKVGDVALQYNGTAVEGMEQFSRLVRETPIGRDAKLVVFRNGAEQTLIVRISQRPVPSFMGDVRIPDLPRIIQGSRSSSLGVEVEPLNGQLADFFGVKEGVLVRSVFKNSAAEKGGLKAGDVIVRVEETKVVTPSEITSRLRVSAGKPVALALIRDRKETTITVTPDDRRAGRATPVRFVYNDVFNDVDSLRQRR